jgi:hypothetical protein
MRDFEVNAEEPINPVAQTAVQALQRDPIAIIRNVTNTIRSSQLRREEFKEIIAHGNDRGRWWDAQGHATKQLGNLMLIRDSPIRWGSTYLMIERALYLRQVC